MMSLRLKSSNDDKISENLHRNMMFSDNMKNGNRRISVMEMKIEEIVIT